MKNTQIIFLILLLLGGSVSAQRGLQLGIRLNPQGNMFLNSVDNEAGTGCNPIPRFGFAGGISIGYGFNDNVGVEANVLYSSQPMSYKGTEDTAFYILNAEVGKYKLDQEVSLSSSWVKVPVFLRFNTSTANPTKFIFQIGPQFNFLTGMTGNWKRDERITYNAGVPAPVVNNYDKDLDAKEFVDARGYKIKEAYNNSHVGLAMQLGAGFRLKEEADLFLSAMLRLDYGFGDIENKNLKDKNGDKVWDKGAFLDAKNVRNKERSATNPITVGLTIGLTYILPLGEKGDYSLH